MRYLENQRKGQLFSVDILLSILPIMLIVGASLQYLYLAEEETKSIAVDSRLESNVRSLSEYVMASMGSDEYPIDGDCSDLAGFLRDAESKVLDAGYLYHAEVDGYHGEMFNCDPADETWSGSIAISESLKPHSNIHFENSMSTMERFVLKRDAVGGIEKGNITSILFSVWK
jgi:hypothetical protein